MTTDTENRLTELRRQFRGGLQGVTPGPWGIVRDGDDASIRPDGDAGPHVWIELVKVERAFADMPEDGDFAPGLDQWCGHQRALAAHIARCSPANILALLDAMDEAERERDEARAELAELRRGIDADLAGAIQ